MTAIGVDRPLAGTPARKPATRRRTSYVDIVWQASDALVLRAGAQDVATDGSGSGELLARARLTVALDRRMTVERITAEPDLPALGALVGRPAGRGFRAAAREVIGAVTGPVALLLDDVPVATLISGYAQLRSGALGDGMSGDPGRVLAMRDLCSGWRGGGTMMLSIDRGDGVPVPDLAAAPDLDLPIDPLAGDPPDALPAGSLRRRRRIDVAPRPDGSMVVEATFRDTFAAADGVEGTLHEYLLEAVVGPDGRLEAISAEPRVLPWLECPAAAGFVGALRGTPLAAVARSLPEGTESCTHLNDLLRSLAGCGSLLDR